MGVKMQTCLAVLLIGTFAHMAASSPQWGQGYGFAGAGSNFGAGYGSPYQYQTSGYYNQYPQYNNGMDYYNTQMAQYYQQLAYQQRLFQEQMAAQQQAFWNNNNNFLDTTFPQPQSQNGAASASASIGLGPQGGYQAAHISPVGPGVQSRFGESLPPPSGGGSVGVFSSSSSRSGVGADGKVKTYKSATTGYNDNGRIVFKTVSDP